jgi:hypothetical protein
MIQKDKILPYFFIYVLLCSIILVPSGKSCKDIIITPAASAGDYSLLLKVRDPSRSGLQVLCRVPKGTQYTYHYPWTGKAWDFLVTHTYIGVATQGDTLPNLVKAGMVLTDAGLAFGDADTLSRWINPTKNAWDDFDWIRYACQTAENEDDAISLLTTEAVDQLHATGVSENLFVVGPQKAVVIEADAIHHTTKDVPDVLVMSNYAKDLWQTQQIRSLPIARSFDAQKETMVRRGSVVHLGSLCGIKILSITPSSITTRVFPVFAFKNPELTKEVTISVGERATVGPYSTILSEINGNTARISMCTSEYAWEQTMHAQIQPQIGNITIQDMIGWSRLHTNDLDGLRPMCEDKNTYEAAMVFKIPDEHANLLSGGWFAANHACSSIYIPVHICDDDFYDPYETGEAAALSIALLQKYGHGNITSLCQSVENVFLFENELNEALAHLMIHADINITPFLTELDSGMQEQAFLTEQFWLSVPNLSRGIIRDIWKENYSFTQQNVQKVKSLLMRSPDSDISISLLEKITQSISESTEKKQDMESLFFIKSSAVHYCR